MRADDDGLDEGEEGHTPPSLASSRIFGPNPQLGERARRHLPPPSLFPFPFRSSHSASRFRIHWPHTHARAHTRCTPSWTVNSGFLCIFFSSRIATNGREEKRLRERIARPEMNSLLPSLSDSRTWQRVLFLVWSERVRHRVPLASNIQAKLPVSDFVSVGAPFSLFSKMKPVSPLPPVRAFSPVSAARLRTRNAMRGSQKGRRCDGESFSPHFFPLLFPRASTPQHTLNSH